MAQGTVRTWNDTKGFGFISEPGITGDVFVHQTEIKMEGRRSLREGQTVEYERIQGPKGWKASAVRVVSAPAQG